MVTKLRYDINQLSGFVFQFFQHLAYLGGFCFVVFLLISQFFSKLSRVITINIL